MTAVKICGLTRLDDALAAVDAGADLLGFVLVEPSPRYVSPEQVSRIVAELRRRGVTRPCVGVVAGLAVERILAIREQCGLDLVQLHGDESAEVVAALSPRVIVARRMVGAETLRELTGLLAFAYLLDARGADRRAAGPATWDWRQLRGTRLPGRIIVAGGLVPENVAEAVRVARPWGVDVASGVECAPGRKDRAAMTRFVKNVREVDDERADDARDAMP